MGEIMTSNSIDAGIQERLEESEKEEDCRQLKELSANLRAELETSKQSNTEFTELECKFKEFESSKFSEYEGKCKSLQDKLLSSESDRAYSSSKLEALEIELEGIKSKLDESVSEKDKLESCLNSTEEKLKSYNSQLEESHKEQTILRTKLSQLEEEKESLQTQAKAKLTNGTLDTTQELSEAVNIISATNSESGSPV